MKNNKGFTLVELIVVIAMMAIIAGVSSHTISTISRQELKDFTNNLDAMLCQTKIETMSGMPDPVLEISIVDGEYRAILYKNSSSTDKAQVKSQYLGEDYLTCTYKVSGSDQQVPLGRNSVISFKYNRSTGELTTNVVEISASDNRGPMSIEFIPKTGYHKIVQ